MYSKGLISQTDGSGVQTYFLGNALGSTEALPDGSGAVAATKKYGVFGAVRGSSGSGSTEYLFTGQQDDATLGYTYLHARYYDQGTGRFLSKDPFHGVKNDPQTFNAYINTQNNPVNRSDPSGKFCIPCVAVTVGAAWQFVVEPALTAADAVATAETLADPEASFFDKGSALALKAAGLLGPGGGGASGIKSFREAQKATRGLHGETQAHHILETRHLKNWGWRIKQPTRQP